MDGIVLLNEDHKIIKESVGLAERMNAARAKAPADPLALSSAAP